MWRVLEGPDVKEGGAYPVQRHVDVTDCLENNLSIQMLHQVTVQAGREKNTVISSPWQKSKKINAQLTRQAQTFKGYG